MRARIQAARRDRSYAHAHRKYAHTPPLSWKEEKARKKAEKKARLLYLSAAMPLPERIVTLPTQHSSPRPGGGSPRRSNLRQVIEIFNFGKKPSLPPRPDSSGRSLLGSPTPGTPGSPDSSNPQRGIHSQTSAPEYPWQYRMRVSPSAMRRQQEKRAEREAMSARKGLPGEWQSPLQRAASSPTASRELTAAAKAAARLAEQRAVHEKLDLEKQKAEEAARQRKVTAQANAAAVSEAARLAESAAQASPIKSVKELEEMKAARGKLREERLAECAVVSKERDDNLKFTMGEAIISRGISIQQARPRCCSHSLLLILAARSSLLALHCLRALRDDSLATANMLTAHTLSCSTLDGLLPPLLLPPLLLPPLLLPPLRATAAIGRRS